MTFSFGFLTALGNLAILLSNAGNPFLSVAGILWGLLGFVLGF